MSTRDSYSDEQLQAFVDDEIDVAERTEIMEAVRQDDELACRVCELLQIKDSLRLAYREIEQPVPQQLRWNHGWWLRSPARAAAAVLIFALGTLTGTSLQSHKADTPSSGSSVLTNTAAIRPELKRVVIHISSAEEQRLDQALSDAEELLGSYKDHPEQVQLEVVANADGLALLRADTSPYPDRIKRLAQQFNNISFLACSRTIEKLHLRGIDVHLLPEARVIPGALEEIVDRMQQGWVYIRV